MDNIAEKTKSSDVGSLMVHVSRTIRVLLMQISMPRRSA